MAYGETFLGKFGHLNSSCIGKSSTVLFWVPREMNLRFYSKTQWQMFLLVSGRHIGDHPDRHQHGVSIQSSVNLGNTLLRIAREWKVAESWFLARLLILQLSIISQILELIYWTITIFSFDHMTDENRELLKLEKKLLWWSFFTFIYDRSTTWISYIFHTIGSLRNDDGSDHDCAKNQWFHWLNEEI